MLISKLLSFLAAATLILLPASVKSEMQEIKEYTVKKGDTLWDISQAELRDPFLWPKIWKENQNIENPDRIYPAQIVKIPLYLLQVVHEPVTEEIFGQDPVPEAEIVKVIQSSEPVTLDPIVSKSVYLQSGYIAETLDGAGSVSGSPIGRRLFGNNDFVYVKTKNDANVGDKFIVVRKEQKVIHPVTREKMGYIINVLGIAEIDRFEYGQAIAKILVSFSDITIGDVLDTFSDIDPPVIAKPFRTPDADGYVVAAYKRRIMNTDYDIVYIDKGLEAGLHPGDLLRTVALGDYKVPNGIIQIIKLNDNTATALVVSSTDPVMTGNWVTQSKN
jgi:hypothetical protein